MEKRRRRREKMHIVFVDLEKAYDEVLRERVWEVPKRRAVNDRYVSATKDMYRGARTSVRMESRQSGSFEVGVRVYQGSALSPYLFILVLDELLKGVIKEALWCMLFADDMLIVGETVDEVSGILEKVREALKTNELTVNKDKQST